ncbi:FAD-dependent oxidoreductase [Agrobacterium sp. Ap1]|uniref:flavin monoamine oxidase family protein n=2 Tax=Rhizobium/Agrobacterium group TaxID=227290 RepID=UPI001A8DD764|nr:FAD-dependent oxidoreductase [Agrobacterium sp. Ap1]MBO0145221.1 FAD-dependent oxidoreductase [Agrobacterium sp. Ap1]
MSNDVDVVIIGAGAAGIAAACHLQERDVSVLLLEASPRLGGRAWTVEAQTHKLDLGCGWLHSAERNPWMHLANIQGLEIDRSDAAWGRQYLDLGFSVNDQREARAALNDWEKRLPAVVPQSDRASDAMSEDAPWNTYIRSICGFSNGVSPDRMSAKDYLAYDAACSYRNWRVPSGMGTLISRSLPSHSAVSLSTPVTAIAEDPQGLRIATAKGDIRARTAILTVSTKVLAGDAIRLPNDLDPWLDAASHLPLGQNEKLFLLANDPLFVSETHLFADPANPLACDFYIRPFGRPVIECYLGGDSARVMSEDGLVAAFTLAMDQLADLFGNGVRSKLKPLANSNWSRLDRIGGAYSSALPGRSGARSLLAKSWKERLFFAGEATNPDDYATAHGAHASGARAANEAIAALARHRDVAA